MNNQEKHFVENNLDLLMQSMALRIDVVVTGTRLTDKPYTDTIIDVVNSVAVEDGSGKNYIISFVHGEKVFVCLSKCYIVRPAKRILLAYTG